MLLSPPAARDWEFPRAVAGVALLVAYAGSRGVDAEAALAGTGLEVADLTEPDREVTATQELRVVRNLQGHLGDVGAAVGRRYHASTFGIFGYALLASRTVLDAMDVALRFLDLSFTFAIPRAEIVGATVRITVDGSGLPPDVRAFLLDRDVAAIRTVLDELVPGGVPTTRRRAADTVVLELDAAELDRPLPQSNPQTLALSEALCRDVVERRRARSGTSQEVRVLVTQQLRSGAPMAGVARELGFSERTLRRRLAAEGTTYQRLLDEVRESLAVELLGTGRLTVEDVALRLGYAEASPFIVAFHRWTGRTPGARVVARTPRGGRRN
jgi:AraC-like DNA-binding protein